MSESGRGNYDQSMEVNNREVREKKELEARKEAELEKFAKYDDISKRLVVCKEGSNSLDMFTGRETPLLEEGAIRILSVQDLRDLSKKMSTKSEMIVIIFDDMDDLFSRASVKNGFSASGLVKDRLNDMASQWMKEQDEDRDHEPSQKSIFAGLNTLRGLNDDREIVISYKKYYGGGGERLYKKIRVGELRPLIEDMDNKQNPLTEGLPFPFSIEAYSDVDNALKTLEALKILGGR